MEPATGIEPVNLDLTKIALYQLSYAGVNKKGNNKPETPRTLGRRAEACAPARQASG